MSSQLSAQIDYVALFFDGGDTTATAMQIEMDTSSNNIWQIGQPQKTIFTSAFTYPNAIVTDTSNVYPDSNTSSFKYGVHKFYDFGITAIQWTQKLHIDSGDVGLIEFSVDSGQTWENVFTSPYTYNYYGFSFSNVDTLANGDIGFSGTDTNWRDIWLCFDYSWVSMQDSLMVRHVFKSDTITSNNDGWMIDNMLQHLTFFHTIGEHPQEAYIAVFPNPASTRLNVSIKKKNQFHIIKELILTTSSGEVLERHLNVPTNYFINIEKFPSGTYFLRVETNISTETKTIVIEH
ncbi:MAG: T9SS type A sorting domain-containing protein [Putridiphycobacter sp.]|nr:T9SS type A sorting domain-containing protein [Putridiphycobacter sp.]